MSALRRIAQLLSGPAYALGGLWLFCLAVCAATVWFAAIQPATGLRFAADGQQIRVASAARDSAAAIPPGATALWLAAAGMGQMELQPSDLIEEPDFFATYAEMGQFFERQTRLAQILRAPEVQLGWRDRQGRQHVSALHPAPRGVGGLPFVFWFQLFVIASAFMISSAVFAVRPGDWGARMFALSGVCALVGVIPVAVYTTRELALDGGLFRLFSAFNHFGGNMFGCAMAALFLLHPRQLVAPRKLLLLPLVFAALFVVDMLRVLPDQHWVAYGSLISLIALSAAGALWQWRRTRGYPLERYALRWFLLSVFGSFGLLILFFAVLLVTGMPPIAESYLTGAFLIMYFGIAVGLRKYRLFDLDEWAYRVFLWAGGALAVIIMDVALMAVGLGGAVSASSAVLLAALLYFPLRQWLWQCIVSKHTPDLQVLLPELSAIAFTAAPDEQRARWENLLGRIFDPLEIRPLATAAQNAVGDEGLNLQVAACGALPAYSLRYSGRGARLFSTRDAQFAAALGHLLAQVMSGRTSYEQGVAQERLRIGRDLHDNIGARLLKLIRHLRGTPDAEVAREAMKDLHTAIAAMEAQPVPLARALADWRAEAGARCEAAGCRLRWQQNDDLPDIVLPPRSKAMLESVLREIFTNALKHAAPANIAAQIALCGKQFCASVENDGSFTFPQTWQDGYGLRNLRGRLEEMGGSLRIAADDNKVKLTIEVTLI